MTILMLTGHLVQAFHHLALAHSWAPPTPQPTPTPTSTACSSTGQPPGDSLVGLYNLINLVKKAVLYVGVTAFTISVAIAAIMRMTAYGSERKVSLSNMALTAAVVGLIIMFMSPALQTFLGNVCT